MTETPSPVIWPPCSRCGSDGHPADFGEGSTSEFLCYDCIFGWIDEITADNPDRRRAMRADLETQLDTIVALRSDPSSHSYRRTIDV